MKTDPGPGAPPPRRTLLLTLLAPSLLGALGIHLMHSLPATFWLSLVFGPVFLVIYLAVRPALGSIDAYRERVVGLGLELDQPLLAAVAFVILNPLLEEWWWRGQATPRCVAAFGPRGGLAVATAGFGLYHVVPLSGLFPLPVAVVIRSDRRVVASGHGW